jgi:hypothetical protein
VSHSTQLIGALISVAPFAREATWQTIKSSLLNVISYHLYELIAMPMSLWLLLLTLTPVSSQMFSSDDSAGSDDERSKISKLQQQLRFERSANRKKTIEMRGMEQEIEGLRRKQPTPASTSSAADIASSIAKKGYHIESITTDSSGV